MAGAVVRQELSPAAVEQLQSNIRQGSLSRLKEVLERSACDGREYAKGDLSGRTLKLVFHRLSRRNRWFGHSDERRLLSYDFREIEFHSNFRKAALDFFPRSDQVA